MNKRLYLLIAALLCIAQGFAQTPGYERSRKYDYYFLEAMMQRQQGNASAAFDLLQRCLELDSMASEVYLFLGSYYSDMKKENEALAAFKRAAELEPNNPIYLETLTSAYISHNQYGEAITVAEKLYETDKSRQELLETLYRLYVQHKEYEKAIGTLERMEIIDGKSERISLAKSGLYIQMDNQEAALKEIKALSEQYPNDLNYKTLYANTLMMDGEREEAKKVLEAILREEPNNYRAQVAMRSYFIGEQDTLRADSLTHSILLNVSTATEDKINLLRQEIGYSENHGGDSTRVLSLFHELLSQPEPDSDIAEFCAHYMALKKMPTDSIKNLLNLALKLSPDKASARLQLVQYAWEEDDDDHIIELCQEARQYNPDEMAFYYYQGMSYYRKKDTDHALEAFQNGISVIDEDSSPLIVSDFYAVMGDLLHMKGMQREAFAAYDSCLQWKPDNIGCLNNYAYYLSELGKDLDRAEEMSHKAVKAEPKNATYLDTYAWIMFMMERYSEARIYIDQALQNDSTPGSVILEHAGDIYAQCNEIDKALGYWQLALTDAPDNKLLRKKIKRKKYIKQ